MKIIDNIIIAYVKRILNEIESISLTLEYGQELSPIKQVLIDNNNKIKYQKMLQKQAIITILIGLYK